MRISVVAASVARDLMRRRGALVLLVALPLAFYVVTMLTDQALALSTGTSVSWSTSGAALFSSLAARQVDQRLVLDGFRPWELVAGRLLVLSALAIAVAGAFATLMAAWSRPEDVAATALGLVLSAMIGVPLGLAIAAVVPRELEGTLLIIAVIGIQGSVLPGNAFVGLLPLGAEQRLLDQEGLAPIGAVAALVHALVWSTVLHAVALTAWRRRAILPAQTPR
jgi:hypothetical protein